MGADIHGFAECRYRWADPKALWSGAIDEDGWCLVSEAVWSSRFAAVHGSENVRLTVRLDH